LSPPCSVDGEGLKTDSSWYRFICEFGAKGDTLNIMAPELRDKSTSFLISPKKAQLIKIDQFYYETFAGFYKHVLCNLGSVIRSYWRLIRRSDCVVFRVPTPGFTLVALIALLLKKPIFVFVSGNIVTQSDSYSNSVGFSRCLLWCVLKLRVSLHSFFLARCNHIFGVSSDVLNLYRLSLKDNVEILRTPVISLDDIVENPKYLIGSNSSIPFKIIRACWLQESKGLENFLLAVKQVSEKSKVKVDIFGVAKDAQYGNILSNLIKRLDLSGVVTLKGWVSNEDLKVMYKDYDLHVMSSVSEGMPRVCLEASAQGIPQLVTPVGGTCDVFTHLHDAYITEDCSAKSLQDGIGWFINNRQLAHDIAKNSILGAKNSSIEVVSKKINHLLENV
jgi:glycosyltransferase involved in cell wall biosynthesis